MVVPPFHTPKWSCLVGKPMVVGETHHFWETFILVIFHRTMIMAERVPVITRIWDLFGTFFLFRPLPQVATLDVLVEPDPTGWGILDRVAKMMVMRSKMPGKVMMMMMMTTMTNIVMMIKMQKMKMIAIPTFIYEIQTNIYPKGIPPPKQRHLQTSSPWGFAPSCLDAKSKSKGEVPRLTPRVWGKIHWVFRQPFLPSGFSVEKNSNFGSYPHQWLGIPESARDFSTALQSTPNRVGPKTLKV